MNKMVCFNCGTPIGEEAPCGQKVCEDCCAECLSTNEGGACSALEKEDS